MIPLLPDFSDLFWYNHLSIVIPNRIMLFDRSSGALSELTEGNLADGYGFDGSSIRGFKEIEESDMLLIPDTNTAAVDPFLRIPTLTMLCNVMDPETREMFSRDPRYVAQKAEDHLRGSGLADVSYWGPELEHFVFDPAQF